MKKITLSAFGNQERLVLFLRMPCSFPRGFLIFFAEPVGGSALVMKIKLGLIVCVCVCVNTHTYIHIYVYIFWYIFVSHG